MDLDKLRRGLLQKIHNTAQTFKANTLDKTDLDERLVSKARNISQNKTVRGLGTAAFNTAAPSLNLVRQIGQAPQYQSAFKTSANQLKNQVTQGIPAMYRLTDFVNPQQPFTFGGINGIRSSQRILQNPQQFASDITKAGSLAATAYGAPKLTPQLMGVSGLLGGAFNRFGGGSFSEGFGKGVAVSPQIAGITRLTNPVINSTASRFSSQFNNPLTRSLTGRGATGALNVPEGMAIDASLGQPTTLGSMGIDFASGFATGRTGTGGKVRLRPSKGLGMAKNQYEYMKPEHKDNVGKLIENLIFKGEDLNYNIQNKSKIEDQLRMYAEMYINKDFAWGTRKAGKGRNAQQIYKTSLQDVAQELMNRIRSENEAPDLFLPQLPFAAKNQTKVATTGLSDVAKKYDNVEDFIQSQERGNKLGHPAPSGAGETLQERLDYDGSVTLREELDGHFKQPEDYFHGYLGPRVYGYDSFFGKETLNNIKKAKETGKIKIYRAVPDDVGSIDDGDWVYFVKEQAETHGKEHMGGKGYKVLEKEVAIDDVWWDGNDIREWGYDSGEARKELIDVWKKSRVAQPSRVSEAGLSDVKPREIMLPSLNAEDAVPGKTLSQLKFEGKNVYKPSPARPLKDVLDEANQRAREAGSASVGQYDLSQIKPKNGRITVYHGTRSSSADKLDGNAWRGLRDGAYVSLTKGNEKESLGNYGAGFYAKQHPDGRVVALDIPIENLAVDSITGELRYVDDTVSRVAQPSKVDTELPEGALGFANISSEGTKMRSGKIKVRDFPTQTEVKNRAELNAGNPDLYTQRGQKLDEMFGNSEPLPWEVNNQGKQIGVKAQGQLSQSGKQGRVDDLQGGSQSKLPSQGVQQRLPTKQSLDDIVERSDINVKDKVNIIDYFRTPDRVFKKVGLEKEVKLLRQKEDDYLQELPKNIDKITEWSERVSPESNKRIFQYLDGQGVKLQGEEQKVAKEIQTWLKGWADRLGLPEDKRITNYITHIFEKDFIQKEFDPEIAKIIRDRVPGSVYDPFVEQRLGKAGYVEDTWRALDAYVKRATRKVHMDEALEEIARKADNLEDSQFNYIKGRLDRINMRPTWIDNMIDNTVKSAIGYKFGQRPVASLSKGARQMVYRATLGLNPGTALKNLTQGANTYAKLGEKYTFKGYSKLVKNFNSSELEDVGILKKDMIQDRSYHATRKFWEKMDKGLFAFFELAEKINRGAAYYGAKAKALDSGATEKEAIEAGKKMVRDTQFTFGAVDTPAVLQSDIGKTLGQFQSFTLKQGEFLTEMAKNKEYLGLLRWAGASLGMVYTVGELIGMEPADLIPSIRIGTPPTLQLPVEVAGAVMDTPDKYGNDRDLGDKLGDIGNSALLFAPGSTQFKKTFEGVRDVSRGYSTNDYGIKGIINTIRGKEGKVRFPVEQTPTNFIRGALFGTNNLPEANEYYDNERTPLGDKQSLNFKQSSDRKQTYAEIIANREMNNQKDDALARLQGETGSGGFLSGLFGGEAEASDRISDIASVYEIDKLGEKPQTTLGKEKWEDKTWDKALSVYNNTKEIEGITPEETDAVIKSMGIDPADVAYYDLANQENRIKSIVVREQVQDLLSQNPDRQVMLQSLVEMRKEIRGKMVLASGVIDDLVDEGLISKAEGKQLKAIKLNEEGSALAKVSGRGGGAKLKKIKFVKPQYVQGKVRASSGSVLNQASAGIANFTQPQISTPNMQVPNIRVGTPSKPVFNVKFNL